MRTANGRAERYKCDGVLTLDEVRAVLSAPTCHYCGTDKMLGLDHVVALAAGGPNRPENLVVCCRSCNAKKWSGDASLLSRWAREYDACIVCGGTASPHCGHGRCRKCHDRLHCQEKETRKRARRTVEAS